MAEEFAPYAPTGAVIKTITQFRDRGLPAPLSPKSLETIGVAGTMAPRTLQALRFLGLLDEDDNPTELFQRLKRASTEEYEGQLAEVVHGAYICVFTIVDPAKDGDIAVADAFRAFEPSKQREKMISLFRGLCAEAGIIEQARQRSAARRPRSEGAAQKPRVRNMGNSNTPPPPPPPGGDSGAGRTPERRDISLGDAGSVTVIADVRWLDLPDQKFTKLRQLIKDIEALEDAGNEAANGAEDSS
jgi:hypothetical protein